MDPIKIRSDRDKSPISDLLGWARNVKIVGSISYFKKPFFIAKILVLL